MPFSPSLVSGGEFSHSTAPASDGMTPSTGNACFLGFAAIITMLGAPVSIARICPPGGAWIRSTSPCSKDVVPASDTCVRNPVSRPSAIATTATSTAAPSPRRTHSPTPSERFIAANTRPPTSSASASDVAAPTA